MIHASQVSHSKRAPWQQLGPLFFILRKGKTNFCGSLTCPMEVQTAGLPLFLASAGAVDQPRFFQSAATMARRGAGVSSCRLARDLGIGQTLQSNILWMDEILHHLRSPGMMFPQFAMMSKWCRIPSIHSRTWLEAPGSLLLTAHACASLWHLQVPWFLYFCTAAFCPDPRHLPAGGVNLRAGCR